jgi:hypothetical protein
MSRTNQEQGTDYESTSIGQENLRQVQDHPSPGCGARDLHELETQAAARIKDKDKG